MTAAQQRLLDRAKSQGSKPLKVRGSDLPVARRLEAAGHVKLSIGGTGLPWKGHWWYEIVPTGEDES